MTEDLEEIGSSHTEYEDFEEKQDLTILEIGENSGMLATQHVGRWRLSKQL